VVYNLKQNGDNMSNDLITYNTAILAKSKGFDVPVRYGVYGPKMKLISDYGNHHKQQLQMVNWNVITKQQPHSKATSIPTQSELLTWLQENHDIDVVIVPERYPTGINYMVQAQKWDLVNGTLDENFTVDGCGWYNDNHDYPTYYLAFEKGLYEGLKLIK